MKRLALAMFTLMICMSLQPALADVAAPNDNGTTNGSPHTLSVDGVVLTKFASVGSEVQIEAHTRGHSGNTIVTADILQYPEMDAVDLFTSVSIPEAGSFIDTVVLSQVGTHENDTNTMVWEGIYTIPTNIRGGVYGASIIAEDGNMRATDFPTQLSEVFRGEVEKVLQSIDTAWDTSNPTAIINEEFVNLQNLATQNGAGSWSYFVATASEGSGSGGSAQLWDTMLQAGHNQYNMSAGANFLEALMNFLDSDDVDAGMELITGLMTYANEFPLPRTMNDFDDVVDYIQEFDPIENFTSFEGTDNFEDAYNALLGSDEYNDLVDALDDLANNTRQFEAVQTIMQNIALLAVSGHPEAIISALQEWAQPIMDMEPSMMTPFQLFALRFVEMTDTLDGETDFQDTDGDDIPDVIIWQYEKLLETTEGQAWTAKMASSAPWVNDAFDDFNSLPEDCLNHALDSFGDPVWENVGTTIGEFGSWVANASLTVNDEVRWPADDDDDDDDEGEEGEEGPTSIIFEELYNIRTSKYNPHALDMFIELRYWGPSEDDDFPDEFSMTATHEDGDTIDILLQQDDYERQRYTGRFSVENNIIEDAVWSFSQPMVDYPKADDVEGAELRMESMLPSMLEAMAYEGIDEMFTVSALGVIVDQDETSLLDSTFDVNARTYDSVGDVEGASVDIAILRISPQSAEEAFATLSPEGEINLTIASPNTLQGEYTGSDLDGDVTAWIGDFDGDNDGREHPQRATDVDWEQLGAGSTWDASWDVASEGKTGLVQVETSGTTLSGLQFTFREEIPLPGSSGCAQTDASPEGENRVNLHWRYESFRNDNGEFDKPALTSIDIDWGDGSPPPSDPSENGMYTDGWESHQYISPGTYTIEIHYSDANANVVTHEITYKTDEGMYQEHDDEYRWDWVSLGWCDLDADESFVPSPEIINEFITDGPLEVNTETILLSDESGEVDLTVTPTLPGVYISIVQSEIVRYGETFTGIGLNLVAVTEASVDVSSTTMVEETTFAGLPVYSILPDSGGLATITITPTGLDFSETDSYVASLSIEPLDLSVPFPDIDEEVWGQDSDTSWELEFQEGDSSRNQEVRINAPLSLMLVTIMEDEDSIWPTAIHLGLLLNEPVSLDITGDLGPGQTANVALAAGEASRILAVATPELGFDPASVDFSAFTEVIYGQGLREDAGFGWISAERERDEHCELFEGWHDDWSDSNSNTRLVMYPHHDYFGSVIDEYPDYSPNIVVTDEDGEISPIDNWYRNDNYYVASFDLDMGEKEYTITSDSEWGLESTFYYEWDDEGNVELEIDDDRKCPETGPQTEAEVFDFFDEIFGNLDSIAWGQGSSADLRLPILSAPQDEYTVISVAQIGQGESAQIVAAFGGEMAEVNPEPPELENLSLSFSPANPLPGDMVVVTIVDEAGQPVDHLSVTLVRDNVTLFGLLTNSGGQVAFPVPEGTLYVRASGGNYYPAELIIIATDEGIDIQDPNGTQIGQDSDADGWTDMIEIDCGTDPLDGTDVPVDSDGDGFCDVEPEPEPVYGCTDSVANNFNASATEDDESCDFDLDDDGISDDVDMCPMTHPSDVDYIDDNGCFFPPPESWLGCMDESASNFDNNADIDDGSCEYDDGSSSSSDKSTEDDGIGTAMIVGSVIGAVALLGIPLLIVLRNKRKDNDGWNDNSLGYTEEDRMFSSPNSPPPGAQGQMMDGYECIEHPSGSGAWWFKDPATGQWQEWR